MRFALVNTHFGATFVSLDKAHAGQVRAARDVGVPMDVVIVGATGDVPASDVRHVRVDARTGPLARLERLVKARVLASVRELEEYDVIFLRYPGGVDLDPLAFLRTTRARVVSVHHAKEPRELLAISRSPGTLVRVGLEHVQGRRILRHVDGVVGVTDEIRDYQLARARRGLPGATVSNGVDVDDVQPTGFVPFDGSELRLVFIASSHAPWHGTDRLRRGLSAYRGDRPIVLDLIGRGSGEPGTEEHDGNVTIRHHGMLRGAALDAVFARATLAISTLAFFRTGLRQAAVLKTREYVARGIPVVLGYDDVDVPPDAPFVLQMPSDESAIPVDALFAFAERVSREKELSASMRAWAREHVDWRVKVRLFDAFARRILSA